MAEESNQLLIRFRGICALIDLPLTSGNKRKRTVLVRHRNGNSGIEHHIPYIEFYADDIKPFPPDLKVLTYTRPGMDGTFARIDLDDATEIRLKGILPGEVEEELNFKRDVPHMSEILSKVGSAENRKVARSLTGKTSEIDLNRAIAVFDMPEGRLFAGEPEAVITRFEPEYEFAERRFARWTDLLIELTAPLVLELVSLPSGATREVAFKKTLRMLTIGNEPERLILGIMPNGHDDVHGVNHASSHDPNAAPAQPTGHFVLYYDVLETPPALRPVPIPTQLTGAGCPNNAYP